MRLTTLIACASLLLGATTALQAATIYKWTDSEGRTHFSAQPPAGQDAERLSTRTSIPAQPVAQPAAEEAAQPMTQKEIDANVRRRVALEEAEMRKYCQDMRTRLSELRNNPRLLAEVDGQMVRLTEDQRQQRILDAQAKLNEHCSSN